MQGEIGEELEPVARLRAVESCRGVRPAARWTIRALGTRDTVRRRFISSQSILLRMLKLEDSELELRVGMEISARIGLQGSEYLNSWGKRQGDQFTKIRGSEGNYLHSTLTT